LSKNILIADDNYDILRIMGLDIGADDYIVKPFSPGEVMARIRAVLRRLDISEEQRKDIVRHPNQPQLRFSMRKSY